ncbi:MAG: PilZ domain-containing protein [Planctomycetes bacterium]|nr:PilZ domain-containing protein [Planctomycetota bacterium]
MFGFLTQKRRDDVQRFLNRRMNRSFLPQVSGSKRRHSRGEFCEVAWVLPYDEEEGCAVFDEARVAVTRDISPEGLSILQTSPLNEVRAVIALEGDLEMHFILCRVMHSTPLGYGFFHIGLHPEEFLNVDLTAVDDLRRRLKQSSLPMLQEVT